MNSRTLFVLGLGSALTVGAFSQTFGAIIGVPNPTKETLVTSINDQGVIAGYYEDALIDSLHGFAFPSPPGCIPAFPVFCFTSFDVPGGNRGSGTIASSINRAGAITGYFLVPSSTLPLANRGYIRDPQGNRTTFDPPGSVSTTPRSINAGGDVAGYYQDLNNVTHGFIRRDEQGKFILFDPRGSVHTTAFAINKSGDVTGFYLDASNRTHGFVRRASGEIESFDPPGSAGTMATAINDEGVITGVYTLNGRGWGFVRRPDGKILSFDTPGSLGISNIPASGLPSQNL